jgi:ubiquinone/menaquinone biosynthesis C-methylase UbiE
MILAGRSSLSAQQDKQARIYEEEVYPLVGQRLADLLTEKLCLPPRAHALQIGCGLGTTTTRLVQCLDSESQLVVSERTPALLERARAAALALGDARVLFQAYEPGQHLPFADGAFDCTLANTILAELAAPVAFLAEGVRVTKPGGTLHLATLLRGSWCEFLDVFADVLVRLGKTEMADALARDTAGFPEPEALAQELEAAGLTGVAVETTRWELIFRTSREFFYAPVIERGPLGRWKAVAGKGPEMQDIFLAVKEAIDTYYGGSAFAVTLVGGVFAGTARTPGRAGS